MKEKYYDQPYLEAVNCTQFSTTYLFKSWESDISNTPGKILAISMSVTRWRRCFSPWGLPRHKYILVKKDFSLKFLLKIFVEETFLFNFYQMVYIWSDHSYSIRMISSIADSEIAITGRARLIRNHSSARFSFKISGNLN